MSTYNISNIKVIHYSGFHSNDPFPEPIQIVLEGFNLEIKDSKLIEFAFYTTHDNHIAQKMVTMLKSKKQIDTFNLRRWGFMLPEPPDSFVEDEDTLSDC